MSPAYDTQNGNSPLWSDYPAAGVDAAFTGSSQTKTNDFPCTPHHTHLEQQHILYHPVRLRFGWLVGLWIVPREKHTMVQYKGGPSYPIYVFGGMSQAIYAFNGADSTNNECKHHHRGSHTYIHTHVFIYPLMRACV